MLIVRDNFYGVVIAGARYPAFGTATLRLTDGDLEPEVADWQWRLVFGRRRGQPPAFIAATDGDPEWDAETGSLLLQFSAPAADTEGTPEGRLWTAVEY